MRQVIRLFTVLCLSFFFADCEEEKPVQPPSLGAHSIVELEHERAKVNVEIVNPGGVRIDNYGILYGKTPDLTFDNSTKVAGTSTSDQFSIPTFTLNELQPGETYYFKGYLEFNKQIIYGSGTALNTDAVEALTSFFPEKAGAGQKITLKTSALYNYASAKVFVGGVEAKIIEKPDFTIIELPAGLKEGSHDIDVDINGKRMTFTRQIRYLGGKWTKKAVFPGGSGESVTFAIGDFIFAGLCSVDSDKFWKYDTKTNQWTEVAPFPGNNRGGYGFAIGQKGYVISGYSSFVTTTPSSQMWEYDAMQDLWTQMNGSPQQAENVTTFTYQNKGYYAFGWNLKLVYGHTGISVYAPDTDSWQSANITFPGSERTHLSGVRCMSSLFAGGGYQTVGGAARDWWEYSFTDQSWTRRADYPGQEHSYLATIAFEHFVLRGGGGNSDGEFFLYNTLTDEWKEVAPFLDRFPDDPGYYINGKVYMLYTYGISQQPSMFEFTYNF